MTVQRIPRWVRLVGAMLIATVIAGKTGTTQAQEQRDLKVFPPGRRHVPELGRYLASLKIHKPLRHGRLAVFPVAQRGDPLKGRWLTMDQAIRSGILAVTEKAGGGDVPVIHMANRSRTDHILIVSGEVVAGGKQTRTIRRDIVLSPGQKTDVGVFCVEAHRWQGKAGFDAADVILPQSIQKEVRKGAGQQRVWSEVARSNAAVGSQPATGSLELGLKDRRVNERLRRVSRSIVPEMPRGSVGFIFVYDGQAVGAEFFGRPDLAESLLPKLIDAYAVDFVLQRGEADRRPKVKVKRNVAEEFLARIRRAGSVRSETPGSGAGIRTQSAGLVGEGISVVDSLVHFGVQVEQRLVPAPPVIMPRGGGSSR